MNRQVTLVGVGPDGRLAGPIPSDATTIAGGCTLLAAHAPGHAGIIVIGDLDTALAAVAAASGVDFARWGRP